MKLPSPSAKSIATMLIFLAGLSGLPGCGGETSSAPKDAAADPAVAEGKAAEDAANKKAGKKTVKSIKDLGR